MKQLIADEKFTNIQRAQAGLTKLFEDASQTMTFYRVMKNDKPLGVLVPNDLWEDFVEDLEAVHSLNFRKKITLARRSKKTYPLAQVKKELGV